jgi:hypothetical protein
MKMRIRMIWFGLRKHFSWPIGVRELTEGWERWRAYFGNGTAIEKIVQQRSGKWLTLRGNVNQPGPAALWRCRKSGFQKANLKWRKCLDWEQRRTRKWMRQRITALLAHTFSSAWRLFAETLFFSHQGYKSLWASHSSFPLHYTHHPDHCEYGNHVGAFMNHSSDSLFSCIMSVLINYQAVPFDRPSQVPTSVAVQRRSSICFTHTSATYLCPQKSSWWSFNRWNASQDCSRSSCASPRWAPHMLLFIIGSTASLLKRRVEMPLNIVYHCKVFRH